MPLDVQPVPMLQDNYAYWVEDRASGATAVIDPAEAGPVLERVRAGGGRLDLVLATHHHRDHVGGIAEIKAAVGCTVVGPAAEAGRIPGLDRRVAAGDTLALGDTRLEVIEVPGHTAGHVAFWTPDGEDLFCGDTLFVLGCGRLLEGGAEAMWESLTKLAALPEATRVWCGHEYTEANARFARHVDPDNLALREQAAEIARARAEGRPTVPSTIARERAANPFLRAGSAGRFAELRRMKDRF